MLKDIFGQAVEAMRHNRRRTAITVVGMAWGIATVVLLLAYGAGFSRAFETIFAQLGTNMIGVFPGTTERAGRRHKGRGEGAAADGRCGADSGDGAGDHSRFAGDVEERAGAERSAHLHVGGGRDHAGVTGHPEDGDGRGAVSYDGGHAAARTMWR